MHTTRRSILEYLRKQGSANVEELAAASGLAPVTVRHHLGLLKSQDLVSYGTEPVGRGRPRHVFHITARGSALMSGDPYETLIVRLVDAVKRNDQAEAGRLFNDMGDAIAAEHRAEFEGLPAEARLDAVVRLLSDEGFTVRWARDPDGSYVIQELTCPFEALGDAHNEVCCMDLRLIQVVMGGEVSRERWRMDGDPSCMFRIRLESDVDHAAVQ